jgi:amino acid adenylation domain-containing protein
MTVPASLVGLVARTAQAHPDQVALVDGSTSLTYVELLTEAERLADELGSAGVGTESVVALLMEPGPRTVVAMLAAGMRGAAFLPIDLREPTLRRRVMQAVARPTVIVTADAVLPAAGGARLDERLPMRSGRAAYVSFTSGSTGVPKGVVTEQPAIVNYVEQVVAAYELEPGDRQLQFSSIAFDIALDEVFSTLSAGGTVVHRGQDLVFAGVAEFLDFCRARAVTVLNLPTGLWNRFGAELVSKPDVRLPACLRLVVVGGEAAQASAVAAWHEASSHPTFRLVNAYGPTEAAVSVTLAPLVPGRPVTIGQPLDGVTVVLRGAGDRVVADGEPGEIIISGVAVARGYIDGAGGGFADIDGAWSYRTGDLARRGLSGDLEFLGRIDRQVKVRGGFRVEPGEVVALLQGQPAVGHAHVQPHQRRGSKVLAAFVVPVGGGSVDVAALRAAAAANLPDWMVPWHIQSVRAIPLTERGKVDEAALAALLPADDDSSEPDDVRSVVLAAWAAAVGAPPESDDASFFEEGGDSLAALELIEILTARLGRAPAMAGFYRAPTVADLVAGLSATDELEGDIPTAHHTTGRTLVRMRRSGGGRLWCFLPPLSGAVTRYATLAARLPSDEAVWAMETPAALCAAGMSKVADGLTERLLDEGLGAFDSIVLSGYSLGGVFAHEVAARVEAALNTESGHRPAVMALLLDPPDPAEPQMSYDEAFDIFVRVGWRIAEPATSFVTPHGYDLRGVAAAARTAGTLPSAAPDSEVADAWTVYAGNTRILDDHRLSEGVARTYLLHCREDAEIARGAWALGEHAGSWSKVLRPGHTSVIAAEHFALLEPPHDRVVLRWLVETAEHAMAR